MDRMKTFGIYALCVILFFIFSNVMINVAIKATYMQIGANILLQDNLKIELDEARATYVNGYVEGSIKNIGTNTENTYIKIDLYSKRNVLLGTKYVKVEDLKQNEERDFRMGFQFTDVDYCKLEIVKDIDEINVTQEQFTSTELRFAKLLATVIMLCYFG